jgi:DNA-binding PadR family transcriptional regulator
MPFLTYELWYIIIRNMARKMTSGPAADPELLILSSLAEGPKHGYAMMQDIAAFSGLELGPGTLYTAITRLVENRWIVPQTSAGRQRPYQLTTAGMEHLRVQLERMRQISNLGLRRLRTT